MRSLVLCAPLVVGCGDVLLPADADLGGERLTARSADLVRWINEHPVTGHPVLDETGADCANGQDGEVFYLAGTFGGDPISRTCTLPAGQPLLIPIVNFWWDNCGVAEADQITEQEMKDNLVSQMESVDSATVTINGDSLGETVADFADYRTEVTAFSYTPPATDSLTEFFGYPFQGNCDSFTTGYYVPLELKKGEHELNLTGGSTDLGFTVDVSYTLIIK
jgi:hypothetical protein